MSESAALTRGGVAALLAVLALGTARARADEPYDPYRIPKDQFARQIRTIALLPVALPRATKDGESVRQTFETLIAEKLRAKGFAVVPSSEFERTWRAFSERMGGLFDPLTGKGDDQKLAAVREHTARELATKHDADAFLSPRIAIDFVIPFAGVWGSSYAVWGEPLVFNGATIGGAPVNIPQAVDAAFLGVSIYDSAWVELYSIRSGIEWVKVFAARGYEDKPNPYRNPERNRNAVDIDLEPLVSPVSPAASGG
jgi:hypothetical protein